MSADEREQHDGQESHSTAHAIGSAVGAASGAMAGAVAGTVAGALAGPLGMAAGGMAGAVLGGMAGRSAARGVDMSREEAFWQENHEGQSFLSPDLSYDDYAPAYLLGATARTRYDHADWDTVEPLLQRDWESSRGNSRLEWSEARHASRAAWERVQMQLAQAMDADADRKPPR